MKKNLSAILVFALVSFSMFAGGNKETVSSSSDQVELSVFAVQAAAVALPDEVPVWKAVEEKTGVKLDFRMIATDNKESNFNLMVASGDVDDIVAYYDGSKGFDSINKYGSEGAFLDLTDLINEYAPNIKSVLLDNAENRANITYNDGKIYVVPMMSAIKAARGWFIRTDWLDKLGLEAPTTTDELYDVLMAFKTQDPNGNGEADEIPMVTRARGDDPFYNLSALAYSFDADPSWVLRGNKVVWGPSEAAYIDYVSYLAKLYKAGLLDQEFLTRQGNPRTEFFTKNQTGCIHDWFASTATLNGDLSASIPGFELKHFAPLVGTASKPYTRIQMSPVRTDGGWAISSTNPDPIATIKMMDFLYSEEGMVLTNFGIEGETYTMVNGVPTYTDAVKDASGAISHEKLVQEGCQWKVGMRQSMDYETQFSAGEAFLARKDYTDNYIIDAFPPISVMAEDKATYTDKFNQIRTYCLEQTTRAVVGAISIDEFKSLMAKINSMGLTEVTAMMQKAYDAK